MTIFEDGRTFVYYRANMPAGVFTNVEDARDILVAITGKQNDPDVEYGFDFPLDSSELSDSFARLISWACPGNP